MTAPTASVSLASRLTAWITEQGIAGGELAGRVAASLLEDDTMRAAAEGIWAGRPLGMLRDAATAVAGIAGADPEEWAREEYLHGHGRKPPRRRKRAPMTTEGEAA